MGFPGVDATKSKIGVGSWLDVHPDWQVHGDSAGISGKSLHCSLSPSFALTAPIVVNQEIKSGEAVTKPKETDGLDVWDHWKFVDCAVEVDGCDCNSSKDDVDVQESFVEGVSNWGGR